MSELPRPNPLVADSAAKLQKIKPHISANIARLRQVCCNPLYTAEDALLEIEQVITELTGRLSSSDTAKLSGRFNAIDKPAHVLAVGKASFSISDRVPVISPA